MNPKMVLALVPTGGRERPNNTPVTSGAVLVVILLLALGGCLTTTPIHKMEEDVHASTDLAVNTQQIRVRMRALVEPLSAVIVTNADRIRETAPNRDVQREALLFKIQAVPALREALFRPDPFNAILDSWVLTQQMSDYFETGRGRTALGDAAPKAVAVCRFLASHIEEVAASMTFSGDVADIGDFARKWAADHPIRDSIAGRESTVSLVTETQLQETFSTTQVAGSLVVTTDDLIRRLDVYSDQLLHEARWQAELFAMDLGQIYKTEEALLLAEQAVESAAVATANANRLLPQLEAALAVAESAPDVMASERVTAIAALVQEVDRTLDFVREERVAALAQLTRERQAAIIELRQGIEKESQSLIANMERISQKVVEQAFIRGVQLTAGALIAAFIGLFVLLLAARRLFGNTGRGAP